MNVDIKTLPAMRVACLRHTGPYNQINATFGKLGEVAGRAGLFQLKGAMMVALYHDDPEATPAAELRSDAGIVVPEDTKLPAGMTEQRIPAGTYACTMHIGPYERLGDTWMRFMGEWIPASGRRIGGGPSFELYLNDPRSTPPEQLKTEICVPIE